MELTSVTMNNGRPGTQVDGIVLSNVAIDEKLHETHAVVVYVEEGVQHPDPAEAEAAFETWVRSHAESAIRTKDDRIARRPNIWPDETQHADVYRAWHLNNVEISIWTSPAPKPPMIP